MPAYRFSWNAFGDKFVGKLADAAARAKKFATPAEARAWLDKNVKRPNLDFVWEHRTIIQSDWLPDYPGLTNIVEKLQKRGLGGTEGRVSASARVKFVRECRKSKFLGDLLLEALHSFGNRDRRADDDGSIAPVIVLPFRSLVCAEQPADTRRPHDYQERAWNALDRHLAEYETTKLFQGLLVMPTGSGKTFTAVRWLLEKLVTRGYRVLWLAHRHELLEQTALAVYRSAHVVKGVEKLRVRIVSTLHHKAIMIDPADQFLICSVGSIRKLPGLVPEILRDPKTILVIDEAHHSSAESYTSLIDKLGKPKKKMILGLTATPYRTNDAERLKLATLFNSNRIYEVSIQELIAKGYLACPIPVIVKTSSDVEKGVTAADRAHVKKFGELSEKWFDRIAHMAERNVRVGDEYMKNKAKYGKTVIFAINIDHAVLLAEDLSKRGLRADYVASRRNDDGGEPRDNAAIIASFREGELDVLVNVQMLTEGVDVPSIQTVFLTRPTKSEVLLRQMIGRALRGLKAGGTAEAHIVSFEDHWSEFREWQSPLSMVTDIVGIPEVADRPAGEGAPAKLDAITEGLPWEVIRQLVSAISARGAGYEADVFEAVPAGCYSMSRVGDDDEISNMVSVYEHQLPCWREFMARTKELDADGRSKLVTQDIYDEYFADCDVPQVSLHEVDLVVEHFRLGGSDPEYIDIPGRDHCDPYKVAALVHSKNMVEAERSALIVERHSGMAKIIYPTLRQYDSAVADALFELRHPKESTRAPHAVPVFDPRPDQMMVPGPHHDLPKLMAKLRKRAPQILGIEKLPDSKLELEWTNRLVKGWFGKAYQKPDMVSGEGKIRINRLLDSPDVSESAMLYLLWHEYLHLYLQQGHTPEFYNLERSWPTYKEDDRYLSNISEKFSITWW